MDRCALTDEYVRHKVLDLIGDLALAGKRIQGQVVAERAGHAMHTALVSRLLKDRSAWELAHVPVAGQARGGARREPAGRRLAQPCLNGRIVSSVSQIQSKTRCAAKLPEGNTRLFRAFGKSSPDIN